MKALTVRQPYASDIVSGDKPIELRSRPTKHRGPLAIHAAAAPEPTLRDYCDGLPLGQIIGVVNVTGCRPARSTDRDAACLPVNCSVPVGWFAWELADPRPVRPVSKRGQLNLWNVPDEELVAAE